MDLKLNGTNTPIITRAQDASIALGRWSHVALVRASGGFVTVYINGAAAAYGTMAGDLNAIDAGHPAVARL